MFIENKYTKLYYAIIKSSQLQKDRGYTERHHILPKCLGGDNTKSNIVRLSARKHFICHKLLVKMVSGQAKYKMIEAVAIFSNNSKRKLNFNSRDIALIREANALASSKRNKGNQYYKLRAPDSDAVRQGKSLKNKNSKWINNLKEERFTQDHLEYIQQGYQYGRLPFSKEHLTKLRNAPSRAHSEETKKRISASHKGKIKSADHKHKISLARLNEPKLTCNHCGKQTTRLNYYKWHDNNCKLKTDAST